MDWTITSAAAFTGFLVGLTGIGAGSIMTPFLLWTTGLHPAQAVATNLWFATLTKLLGASIHQQGGHVDWQVARRLWLGSLPVAALTVSAVAAGARISKVDWLTQAIGTVVIVTALGMVLAPALNRHATQQRLMHPRAFLKLQPLLTSASGALLGACVALTSVGGGALASVMLRYLYPLRMTPHRLVATDLVHAIPMALMSALGYWAAGLVQWNVLIPMLLGSLPGVWMGSLAARRTSSRRLQWVLAVALMAIGVKTLF